MHSKEVKINTKDDCVIYGTQTFSSEKSEKIVIFVHGFTGHKDEHIFFNGAKFFNENGYDVFRFDLYSEEDKGRNFRDTSIQTHAKDTTEVVNYFKNSYKKIYLVGHSYGGTTLLLTDVSAVLALVFWDASYITNKDSECFEYNNILDEYISRGRVDYLVGKKFVDELMNFPDCGELVSKINKPVKFITAGDSVVDDASQKYYKSANEPKGLINIPTADHCFNGFKEEKQLFEETHEWIKIY